MVTDADFANGVATGVASDFATATATASCSATDVNGVDGVGTIVIAMFLSLRNIFYGKKKRVIGIDPGRANIIYGCEKLPDGNIKVTS